MKLSDSELLQNIGKVIKWNRKKAKLNQENLSSTLEVSQAALSRYEKGKTNMPVLTLKRIADTCDFDMVDYFIEIETPSNLYKAIVGKEVATERNEDDIVFDEYMSRPKNADKVKALYHASKISDYMPSNVKYEFVSSIQYSITHDVANDNQYARLMSYMKGISNIMNNPG